MALQKSDCCVLNGGNGAWAFEPIAAQLAAALGIDIAEQPRRFNYVLHTSDVDAIPDGGSFIPIPSIVEASDKRRIAATFNQHRVPAPETCLLDEFDQVLHHVREHRDREWCLKFPISCGAGGHRLITVDTPCPRDWPRPFVVQEFIRLQSPEVYRTYVAGGELFGWVVRRFPAGKKPSPWVAHARGARYAILRDPPEAALAVAAAALRATGLWDSFGCVDLLQRETGEWVALEVGTDGLFNHVDRDLNDPVTEGEILRRVCDAFWKRAASCTATI